MRSAKNTQHHASKVLPATAMQNDDGGLQSAAPGTKSAKVLRLSHRTAFDTMKLVAVLQSATPATRNEAQRLKPPKVTTFSALPIGTVIGDSRKRLRTVGDG